MQFADIHSLCRQTVKFKREVSQGQILKYNNVQTRYASGLQKTFPLTPSLQNDQVSF